MGIEQIINRIIKLSQHKNEEFRYLHQLRFYTKLRKLFDEKIEDMPITFDENIEEDTYYQKGEAIGIQKGMEKNAIKTIIAMLKKNMSIALICEITETTEDFVLKTKKENSL